MEMSLPTLTGAPVLETQRLLLRVPSPSDFPAFLAYATSHRTAFTGGAKPEHAVFEKFASMIGHWALRGFGRFTITDRTSGAALGHVGPFQLVDEQLPELSWTIWSDAAEGKGIAFEAAQTVNHWLFGPMGWTEAIAEVHPDNHRSQTMARRLGGELWTDGPRAVLPGGDVYRFTAQTIA
ncbi:GNAT family N-acetyltransferase [Roseibium polysiphoniae]|uniref:GNAT family N-acetyltransferase n=1 Tax=Roseibium polysiphoniae TaxID=2571221 RepID=A0ABR9CDZ6_9HYPH|nr:GNAT family N-acetyltransferase [Roseibium polysiphoniae]MBD8878114.1 GNAT family N-acetyltransferase [Roseibium polysiphoniae]